MKQRLIPPPSRVVGHSIPLQQKSSTEEWRKYFDSSSLSSLASNNSSNSRPKINSHYNNVQSIYQEAYRSSIDAFDLCKYKLDKSSLSRNTKNNNDSHNDGTSSITNINNQLPYRKSTDVLRNLHGDLTMSPSGVNNDIRSYSHHVYRKHSIVAHKKLKKPKLKKASANRNNNNNNNIGNNASTRLLNNKQIVVLLNSNSAAKNNKSKKKIPSKKVVEWNSSPKIIKAKDNNGNVGLTSLDHNFSENKNIIKARFNSLEALRQENEELEKMKSSDHFLNHGDTKDFFGPDNSNSNLINNQISGSSTNNTREDEPHKFKHRSTKQMISIYDTKKLIDRYLSKHKKSSSSKSKAVESKISDKKIHEESLKYKYFPPSSPLTCSTDHFGPFYSNELAIRRTEVLLKLWIDSGPLSKLDVMSVAINVIKKDYQNKLELIESPFTELEKKYEFNQFCAQVNMYLDLFERTELISTICTKNYRVLFRLYGIFNNAVKSDISSYDEKLEDSVKQIMNKIYSEQAQPDQIPNNVVSTKHETFISNHNSSLSSILGSKHNALKIFLVTYGRYIEIGKVNDCSLLKDNPLNVHVYEFYQRFPSTIPRTFTKLPGYLEAQLKPEYGPNFNKKSSDLISLGLGPAGAGAGASTETTNNNTYDILSSSESNVSVKLEQDNINQLSNKYSISDSKLFGEQQLDSKTLLKESSLKLLRLPSAIKPKSRRHKSGKLKKVKRSRKSKTLEEKLQNIGSIRPLICVKNCQFHVVKRVAVQSNFKCVEEKEAWNIMWSDVPLTNEKLNDLRRHQDSRAIFDIAPNASVPLQKLNHFPGMNEICRKDRLARNLKRMQRYFPKDYDFFPETWTLPTDLGSLVYHAKSKKNCTFICKPDTGSQGKGIYLVRDINHLNPFNKLIVQLYVPRPFLIDGYKFDLRIYALITCCDPLRIYLYNEGIVRFATVQYVPPNDTNLNVRFMHLTNYSLNKFSQSYIPEYSKRKLTHVYEWMRNQGLNVDKLKSDIDSIVIKTMISAQKSLKHYYRAAFPKSEHGSLCFEVLGFDILIDEKLKPLLLEVNHSPSFNLDLPLDEEIKRGLINNTLSKIYLGSISDKGGLHHVRYQRGCRSKSPSMMMKIGRDYSGSLLTPILQKQFEHEEAHGLNYRLIHPLSAESFKFYDRFTCQASSFLMSDDEKDGE